jgi:hypothetical protein
MINFMIFGDVAINMAFVNLMRQDGHDVVLWMTGQEGEDGVRVTGVTIDDILTAQAAGQARVTAPNAHIVENAKIVLSQPKSSFSQRRSSRFREPEHNDPQAMKSIGRR